MLSPTKKCKADSLSWAWPSPLRPAASSLHISALVLLHHPGASPLDPGIIHGPRPFEVSIRSTAPFHLLHNTLHCQNWSYAFAPVLIVSLTLKECLLCNSNYICYPRALYPQVPEEYLVPNKWISLNIICYSCKCLYVLKDTILSVLWSRHTNSISRMYLYGNLCPTADPLGPHLLLKPPVQQPDLSRLWSPLWRCKFTAHHPNPYHTSLRLPTRGTHWGLTPAQSGNTEEITLVEHLGPIETSSKEMIDKRFPFLFHKQTVLRQIS